MSKELDFLEAYKKLCLEHGFQIRGCGECGSAWLEQLGEEELRHKQLTWEKDNEDFVEIQFATDYDIKREGKEQ